MFLGGGGVIGLKAEKEEEKKKKYFKAIFLQISVHPAFFKKFNFPHRLKISQRYTAKTKYLVRPVSTISWLYDLEKAIELLCASTGGEAMGLTCGPGRRPRREG